MQGLRCPNGHTWSSSGVASLCPHCGKSGALDASHPIASDQTLDSLPMPAPDRTLGLPEKTLADGAPGAEPPVDGTLVESFRAPPSDAPLAGSPSSPPEPHDITLDPGSLSASPHDMTLDSGSLSASARGMTLDSGSVSASEADITLDPSTAQKTGHPAHHPTRPGRPLDQTLDHAPRQNTHGPKAPDTDAGKTAPQDFRAFKGLATFVPGLAPIQGYEILEVLGRGGMGVVYKARQTQLNRVVALKMILSGGNASAEDLARFQSEAHAVAKMQHPNILQIYDIGQRDGKPFFSLEFVDGGTLQRKLEKNPMNPRAAAKLVETIARALHYAHEKGILHRDIKPANVLLAADGSPKIADFGLAKALDREESLQPSSHIVGTPVYMSPEQATGKADIGRPADIYSLGATLYEMLVGRPPFRGSTVLDTLRQVQEIEPVPPRQLQPSVPIDLQTICLKSLEKDPKKRYATAEEFADDLRNFLEDLPIKARAVSRAEKAWKWSRRNPASAALLIVGVLSLVGFAVGGFALASVHSHRAQIERDRAQAEGALRREADLQRDRAVAQEKLAKERGDEAIGNFHKAQEAIGVLVHLAQQRLSNERQLDTVGKELMEQALVFYDHFLKLKPDDPLMRFKVARANLLAGDIREKLARYEQARDAFQNAATQLEQLIVDDPEYATKYRADLASVLVKQAIVFEAMNDTEQADLAFEKALPLLEQIDLESSDEITQWLLGAGCISRGTALLSRGKSVLAEEAYRRATPIFAELSRKYPSNPTYPLELANAHNNLGSLFTYEKSERLPQAEEHFRTALNILTPLAKKFADVPLFRKELGRAHLNRGRLRVFENNPAGAQQDYEKALSYLDDLRQTYPKVGDYAFISATASQNLGNLKKNQGDFTSAVDHFAQARVLLEKLARDEPKLAGYRLNQAQCTAELAETLDLKARDLLKTAGVKNPALPVQLESAEKTYLDAFALFTKVQKDFPALTQVVAGRTLAFVNLNKLYELAVAVNVAVNPANAERLATRRLALLDQVGDALRTDRDGVRMLRALLRSKFLGKHAEAAEDVEAVAASADASWMEFPRTGLAYAYCVTAVNSPKTAVSGSEVAALTTKYGKRALELLGQAVDAGSCDAKFLQHPDLEPLRMREEFKEGFEALVKRAAKK